MPDCGWPFLAGVAVGAVLVAWAWALARHASAPEPSSPPPQTGPHQGVVKSYDRGKGYGFVTRDPASLEALMYYSAIAPADEPSIKAGDRVEFIVIHGQKGPIAGDVRRVLAWP